jgi:hypothetical protein
MVDDRNIGFKSRKIRRNETGIYNVFVEWGGGGINYDDGMNKQSHHHN